MFLLGKPSRRTTADTGNNAPEAIRDHPLADTLVGELKPGEKVIVKKCP